MAWGGVNFAARRLPRLEAPGQHAPLVAGAQNGNGGLETGGGGISHVLASSASAFDDVAIGAFCVFWLQEFERVVDEGWLSDRLPLKTGDQASRFSARAWLRVVCACYKLGRA